MDTVALLRAFGLPEEPEREKVAAARAGPASGTAEWPEPLPLLDEVMPVPPLQPEWLPKSLRPWQEDTAERMDVPLSFPAAAALVGLGAVVGRRACITPWQHDKSWRVVPNLWGAVIGRPGTMKSPSLQEGLAPLRLLERQAQEDNRETVTQYRLALEKFKIKRQAWQQNGVKKAKKGGAVPDFEESEPEEPKETRYLTNDGTAEKIHELLKANPGGLLVFRDELTGWLANLEKPGREGERAFFLESWDGNVDFTYDRIGRGSVFVPGLCLSVFGGVQPARLQAYMPDAANAGASDDGLLQRFQVLVWPEMSTECRVIDRSANTAAKAAAVSVFERLASLSAPFTVEARFDGEAQSLFSEWFVELKTRLLQREMPNYLESHLAKYKSLMPTLALLFRLADWAAEGTGDNALVTLPYARLAAAWCAWLETHGVKVYRSLRSGGPVAARALAEKIRKREVAECFAARDVYLKGWTRLDSPEAVKAAAEVLIDLGWLRQERKADTGGAPATRYRVNPRVWEVEE